MSRRTIKLHQEHANRVACTALLQQLRIEIAAGPWRVINVMEQAAACLIENTGGSLLTQALRTELAECQRLIAVRSGKDLERRKRRPQLRLVNAKGGEA